MWRWSWGGRPGLETSLYGRSERFHHETQRAWADNRAPDVLTSLFQTDLEHEPLSSCSPCAHNLCIQAGRGSCEWSEVMKRDCMFIADTWRTLSKIRGPQWCHYTVFFLTSATFITPQNTWLQGKQRAHLCQENVTTMFSKNPLAPSRWLLDVELLSCAGESQVWGLTRLRKRAEINAWASLHFQSDKSLSPGSKHGLPWAFLRRYTHKAAFVHIWGLPVPAAVQDACCCINHSGRCTAGYIFMCFNYTSTSYSQRSLRKSIAQSHAPH